jgi:hypothetical protein
MVLLAALASLGLVTGPGPSTRMAYAEDDIYPLPRGCRLSCLTGPSGNYCGIGAGQKGCKSIVNGNCVFVICPI